MALEMKTCTGCGVEKPVSEYFLEKRRGKPRARCKACCSTAIKKHYQQNKDYYAEYAKRWRAENRERSNATSARHTQRLRDSVRSAWFEHQGGACAICGQPQDGWEGMHLDHCHRTGRVRGLLCKPCNYILAMCDDRADVLEAAIGYLAAHDADPTAPKRHRKLLWAHAFPPGKQP